MRLGGIDIPFTHHLDGHSDADVLMHAITDALLGGLALGDIGQLFPNTDGANQDRDSADFLIAATGKIRDAGWEIANLDCIIFAQEPKIGPHRLEIQNRLAELMQITTNQIGIKAKTGESVGPVGRQEAMMAQCVCLLYRNRA